MTGVRAPAASPAVFLMGPTAAGKTALALELVRRLPVDIISVDSAMVYRGMDIGTGKPPREVLAEVPHHLTDIRDPRDRYSAGDFRVDARRAIDEIRGRGRIPLLVGGTGLYFRALRHGLSRLPAADPAVRRRIEARAAERGWEALHRRLRAIDPVAARRIHPNDTQRIQRALEVFELSGKTMSEALAEEGSRTPPLAAVTVVVAPADRAELHRAIARRFTSMLEAGFVGEVERLRAGEGMHADLPSMRAVGYRQIWAHLDGRFDYGSMVERGIAATRQLARRQLTWLRSEAGATWFDGGGPARMDRILALLAKPPPSPAP